MSAWLFALRRESGNRRAVTNFFLISGIAVERAPRRRLCEDSRFSKALSTLDGGIVTAASRIVSFSTRPGHGTNGHQIRNDRQRRCDRLASPTWPGKFLERAHERRTPLDHVGS